MSHSHIVRPKRSSARHAERSATLCGFSSNAFDDIVLSRLLIQKIFVESGIGEIVDEEAQDFRGHYCLTVGNRYFTPQELVPHETYQKYPEEIDPFDLLHAQAMMGSDTHPLIRTRENDVGSLESRLVVGLSGKR